MGSIYYFFLTKMLSIWICTCIFVQVPFDIEMRDDDGSSFQVIDTFGITATFPSDNQEQVFTGYKGIANITLTYDLVCIDPDACNAAVASSDIMGTGTFV